jgi:type I restriction enzyme S subunit
LAEQQRIADKLDALLARVNACRDRLDRVPGILSGLRRSVIAAATSGALTESWRAELGVSEPWSVGSIGDLLAGKPRNGYSPRAVEYTTPVRTLTLSATTSGRFLAEHHKFVDEVVPPESHLWLQPGDILIQRANSLDYVGTSVLYDGPAAGFIYPDLMMKVRANPLAMPGFLLLLLKSPAVRSFFRSNATGTAGNMPKINQQSVLNAPAKWPGLAEQAEIVRRVEALFALADAIEARTAAARAQVERLTPALLNKAFRGELVPQDPNDEPASALLARLREPAAHVEAPATASAALAAGELQRGRWVEPSGTSPTTSRAKNSVIRP